jgi:probable rRNA maturation factor
LRVAVVDYLGRPCRVPGLAAWLQRVAPTSVYGDISLALVSDRLIQALNAHFRRRDSPTDVLSFPDTATRAPRPAPRAATRAVGDIVISTDTARRQAREAGHSYATELKVLALHGLLHLLGYDHHARSDRGRMARMERRLRAKGGLREGLIERAAAPKK